MVVLHAPTLKSRTATMQMDGKMQKVFGIGFHKTGTTSLGMALEHLGYNVRGHVGTRDPVFVQGLPASALALVPSHDAFQDNPWPLLFRELDEAWPGSLFIMTTRDETDWLASVSRHFGTISTPMREHIYGAGHGFPIGNEDLYLERFRQHHRDVRRHFKDREDQLLELPLVHGAGWEPLCEFLGRPVPDVPFPKANQRARARPSMARRLASKFKRMLLER